MRLITLKCPECNGKISVCEIDRYCFCNYCGSKIYLDDETQKINISHNVNISRTTRHIDETELERIRSKERDDKRTMSFVAIWFGVLLLIVLLVNLYFFVVPKIAQSQGKISAGYYRELIGDDYTVVEAHLKAAGFKNVEIIDLNDSGIAFWSKGKVASVSIGGNAHFEDHHYFDPDIQVVISHH